MEIVINKNLREIYGGEWENKKLADSETEYKEEYVLWHSDLCNARCTEGESMAELAERVMATLTEIVMENEGKTIVVATHGLPIRAMQTLVQYGDLSKLNNVPLYSNASVTAFEYNDGNWRCINSGYDKHLADTTIKYEEK